MGVGRFACVALPFALTLASLICILIAGLSGVTDKNLDIFTVTTKNLSISSSSLANFEDLTRREEHFSALTNAALNAVTSTDGSVNITAADLDLADSYKISLWGYCSTTGSNTTCTKAKFNWAASALNTTEITTLASSTGVTVTLPKEVRSALKTFVVIEKWIEVVYIIALATAAVELFVGLFGFCSRVGSCCTFIISGISTLAIIVASVMATVMASIVVGALDSTTKAYGVHASINTSFLAITWLAVVFSVAGGLFWMFTICCCASDHHSNRRNISGDRDQEKLIPTGRYQPVGDPYHNDTSYAGQQHGIYNSQPQQEYGVLPSYNGKPAQRASAAYEPYSHTAV